MSAHTAAIAQELQIMLHVSNFTNKVRDQEDELTKSVNNKK